jgi:hypothetical protein
VKAASDVGTTGGWKIRKTGAVADGDEKSTKRCRRSRRVEFGK